MAGSKTLPTKTATPRNTSCVALSNARETTWETRPTLAEQAQATPMGQVQTADWPTTVKQKSPKPEKKQGSAERLPLGRSPL